MGILAWIILGALAGWIGSIIMRTNAEQGVFANIIVGIIGAVIGGFVFGLLGGSSVSGLNLYSLLVAVVGAIILIAICRALTGRRV